MNQNKTAIRRGKKFFFFVLRGKGGGGAVGQISFVNLLYKGNVPFRSFNCKETEAKEFTDKAVLYDI